MNIIKPSLLLCTLLIVALPQSSISEIIRDGSVGTGPTDLTLDSNNTYSITQDMGDTLGETLLHSFDQFTIETGNTANFTGDAAIKNIITRVTGNGLSTIDGTINSSINGANFYFVNPNGIIIGPNGSINVSGGSVNLSTASSLEFDNGEILYVDKNLALPSSITTASIAGFGFLNQDAGNIRITDNYEVSAENTIYSRGEKIRNAKDITLHSNDVDINNSTLSSSNKVSIIANSITLNNNSFIQINGYPENKATIDMRSQTDIELNNSVLQTNNGNSEKGKISLIANNNIHLDNSDIASQIQSNQINAISSDVYIEAKDGDFSMSNPNVSSILTRANNGSTAGNIDIKANNVDLRDGARIQSLRGYSENTTTTEQDMGNITITAKERFSMSGFGGSEREKAILQASNDFATGDGGNITVTAGEIDIQDRAFIVAGGGGENSTGGDIQLTSTIGDITTSNNSDTGDSGSLIFTNGVNGADAGNITIDSENDINLLDNTTVSAGPVNYNTGSNGGKAGNIDITAKNSILLAGKNNNNTNPEGAVQRDYRGSRIQTKAANGPTEADAGNIKLTAENVTLKDEATILNNSTFGNGGDITIDATETLDVNDSLILTSTRLLENDESGAGGNGDAGDITLSANNIQFNQANIESKSVSGNGGDITFDISDSLIAINKTLITTETDKGIGGNIEFKRGDLITAPKPSALIFIDSEIKSTVSEGSGDGGNISFEAESMILKGNTIATDTDSGTAGTISFAGIKPLVNLGENTITVNANEQGTPGAIVESDLTITEDDLAEKQQLATQFIDASSLIRQHCSVYTPDNQFNVFNQVGVATSPEGLLPSIDPITTQVASVDSASKGVYAQNQGATTFRSGDLETAKLHWTEAVNYYAASNDEAAHNNSLRGLAQTQQSNGEYNASVATLAQAVDIAHRGSDQTRLAESLGSLGNALIASGNPGSAQEMLEKAVSIAEETRNNSLAARLRNNLGNYYSANNLVAEALDNYLQSIEASIETDQYLEATKAYANIARLKINDLEAAEAFGSLKQAESLINAIESDSEKANLHIHLAKSYSLLAQAQASFTISLQKAYNHLQQAKSISQQINDDRLLSYALGNLGELYKTEARLPEALTLTRQALSLAENANAPESQYRWHWQEGQLLRELGKTRAAVDAYQRAITIIEDTRQTTLARYESADVYFKQQVQPVYRELADILIQSSVRSDNELQAQQLLRDTRDIIEQLKTAELENYFHDDCIANFEAKRKNLDDVSPKTAIIYPIVLKDRVELLVSLPDLANPYQRQLIRRAVPVAADTLHQSVNDFREHIEAFTYRSELQHKSQPLYNWLVKPYADDLKKHNVDTIVFVPDGTLRTLPLSALYDGQQYLIENYAIAITSSLTLSDPQPLSSKNNQILLAGVSEAINNFPALEAVPGELAAVQKLYGGDVLLDNEFTADAFTNKVKNNNYSIIHIASHAQFTGDDRNSFLQAHDQPLFMEGLRSALSTTKYRDEPLEMLVLSACQTASGDERAALGLAGVGIKAGARSAMGSLWNIGDDSASELIGHFYTELQLNNTSKAEALRQAQLSLLSTDQYSHPAHWAAFMLIDNWL